MKIKKVLAFDQLPMRLPFYPTAVLYLLLDHFRTPEWVWGATGLLVIFGWWVAIYDVIRQESTRIRELE